MVLVGRDVKRLASAAVVVGGNCETCALDVTNEAGVAAFFATQPPMDHLVTAAAGTGRGTVVELEVTTARALFDSKYWGQYMCAKYAIPLLKPRGSIVLFSGWVSRKPMAGTSTLASVDAAIEALGRTLALEIAPRRANVVMPGAIDTPLWGARLHPNSSASTSPGSGSRCPLGAQAQHLTSRTLYAFCWKAALPPVPWLTSTAGNDDRPIRFVRRPCGQTRRRPPGRGPARRAC